MVTESRRLFHRWLLALVGALAPVLAAQATTPAEQLATYTARAGAPAQAAHGQ